MSRDGTRSAQATTPGGLERDVELAPLCTLELGGRARFFVEAHGDADVVDGARWASSIGVPVLILGGGSNVVVADGGVDALVIRMAQRGIDLRRDSDGAVLTVRAGERWDDVVATTVEDGWNGIECLSGIPGTAGATPIQNVGAYGIETSDVLVSVRALDLATGAEREMQPGECALAYRSSRFRTSPGRFAVLAVSFRLGSGAPPPPRYPELARRLAARAAPPTAADVRAAVLELRRAKSMILEPRDENHRSVGSFFTNPVVGEEVAARVVARAIELGLASTVADVPAFATAGGVKLSAAWLVERSGFPPGSAQGRVGVSTRHALALVNRGGATTAELIAFARGVRRAVHARFGVTLAPEPVLWGFGATDPLADSVT